MFMPEAESEPRDDLKPRCKRVFSSNSVYTRDTTVVPKAGDVSREVDELRRVKQQKARPR